MDHATREILKLLLLPPGGLVLLLLLGWLSARRLSGRLLLLIGILGLYAGSTPVTVHWLAANLETIPPPTEAELQDARPEAILVFLAGARRSAPEADGSAALSALSLERMDHALALHRKTGLPLILSGGSPDGGTPPAQIARDWLYSRAKVRALAVDERSRDTGENAIHSAALLRGLGLQRVVLVTHAAHMRRALFSARAAGIEAIAAPHGYLHSLPAPGERIADWLPHPGYLGRSYLILHEMVGGYWYRVNR